MAKYVERVAKCRLRLGIGDAPVGFGVTKIGTVPGTGWKPPNRGVLKVNFEALMPDSEDGGRGGITALARNSSGDLLGFSGGAAMITGYNKLGLQLYALKAASNLAKKLSWEGKHLGPVVYESRHAFVTAVLFDKGKGEPGENLDAFEPDDLEEVAAKCVVITDQEGLRWLPRDILEMVERDKANAGIINSCVSSLLVLFLNSI